MLQSTLRKLTEMAQIFCSALQNQQAQCHSQGVIQVPVRLMLMNLQERTSRSKVPMSTHAHCMLDVDHSG